MPSYSLEPHSEKIEHFQYLCIHLEGFLQVRGIESVQCREEGIYWGCRAISIGSALINPGNDERMNYAPLGNVVSS